MRSRYPNPKVFSHKLRKELGKTAHFYSQPNNIHVWRQEGTLRPQLTRNRVLMKELYKLSNNDPKMVNQLLNYGEFYIRDAALKLQQRQQQNLNPNHPDVINNINHPLNPANPNTLQLYLQINPALNPMFLQYINIQSEVIEDMGIENEENQEHENQEKNEDQDQDQLMQNVLKHELVLEGAKSVFEEKNDDFNPYQTLGLKNDASKEEIQTAALGKMADNAPKPNEKPSHEFAKVAAAAALLLTGKHEFGKDFGMDAEKNQTSTPTAAPGN